MNEVCVCVDVCMMDELMSMVSPVMCRGRAYGIVVCVYAWLLISRVLDNRSIAPTCFLIGVVLGPLKMYIPWLSGPKGIVDMVRIVSAGITGQYQYIS